MGPYDEVILDNTYEAVLTLLEPSGGLLLEHVGGHFIVLIVILIHIADPFVFAAFHHGMAVYIIIPYLPLA